MSSGWVFPETPGMGVQGRDLAEDNFAHEERSGVEILMREALQNPLDARDPASDKPVRVSLRLLSSGEFDQAYLESLISSEYSARLAASIGDTADLDIASARVLVIEDFGTIGLRGTYDDSNVDGDMENWNAFWFREGEGAKAGAGSNGRAGQGKVTFYRMSRARAVFGSTIRSGDGRALLMGRSSFRRGYRFDERKYERHSFWCAKAGGKFAVPVQDSTALSAFSDAFRLTRKGQGGLTLVIPFPQDFDPATAIRAVVSDFYFPVAQGRLEVTIQNTEITASSVDAVAEQVFSDSIAREQGSSMSKGFRSFAREVIQAGKSNAKPVELAETWTKQPALNDAAFPAGAVEALRQALATGTTISVRFPITVRPKKSPAVASWFDVHLQIPDDLEKVEEAIIRRDLLIGAERHLSAAAHLQKARGLVVVEHEALSALLADAEEPTHLKWNASRPRLTEDYQAPREVIRNVRAAMPRLLSFISGAAAMKDIKALAKYFAKPGTAKPARAHGGSGAGTKAKPPVPKPIPPAIRKPFRIDMHPDRIRVVPSASILLHGAALPLAGCVLECAYEGLDQDPFSSYDPLDFDIGDTSVHDVSAKGINVTSVRENRVDFDVIESDFELEVRGFDKHLRLTGRVTYKLESPAISEATGESVNGTIVSHE